MNKLKSSFKKALKIAVVVLIGMVILGIIVGKDKDAKQPNTETADKSKAAEQATTKTEVSTNTSKTIEGIEPVDVYGNFEKKGFKVDKQISTDDGSLFICTSEDNGIQYEAKVFCESGVTDVTTIRLSATRINPQYNKVDDMKPFLKFGCSVPYTGFDAAKVSEFIDHNYNKNKASIVISGVKFTIYVPTQFARMIDVEKE